MKRFLLAVGAIGLTAVASNSAIAKGGVLHLFKSQMEAFASTSPASHAGAPSLSEFLMGAAVTAIVSPRRTDAEARPTLAISSVAAFVRRE